MISTKRLKELCECETKIAGEAGCHPKLKALAEDYIEALDELIERRNTEGGEAAWGMPSDKGVPLLKEWAV